MAENSTLFENLQIQTGQLPQAEEQEFVPHPDRYKRLSYIWLSIFSIILCATWIIPVVQGEMVGFFIAFPLWLVVNSLLWLETVKSFAIRGYLLRQHDISYRKGFLKFSLITIPYTRIQHSEITQGPLARAMKLSTLNIFTAGGSSSDLKIPGLDPEDAQKLRTFIAEKIGKNE